MSQSKGSRLARTPVRAPEGKAAKGGGSLGVDAIALGPVDVGPPPPRPRWWSWSGDMARPPRPHVVTSTALQPRACVLDDGVEFEVVWDGRRDGPSLLPADYPSVDARYHESTGLANADDLRTALRSATRGRRGTVTD